MNLADELKELSSALEQLPHSGMRAIGGKGAPTYVLDFIIIGAVKRTLSLGHGLITMVQSKNMTCARALVRMQIDTVSRLLAYTYVDDPEEMARAVIGGKPLKKFKNRERKPLTDAYLIDRMTERHSWTRTVYDSTCGEVHFSEKQFFASIQSMEDDGDGRTIGVVVAPFDSKYPEASWTELAACFRELCGLLVEILDNYAAHKNANKSSNPVPRGGAV